MSTRFTGKITLTSWLVFVNFLALVTSNDGAIFGYKSAGMCLGRAGKRFPTTFCGNYLSCDLEERGTVEKCDSSAPFFNITSKQCVKDTTPPCEDTKKITVFKWDNIEQQYQRSLEENIMPSRPPTEKDNHKDLDAYKLNYNSNFGVLIKTLYLAVGHGNYTFRSECIGFCKLWIRKTECGTATLVLHQKTRKTASEPVEYHRQDAFPMEFGRFYHLDIVHIGNGKNTQFQIGRKTSQENIKSALLRLPEKTNLTECPNPSKRSKSFMTTPPHSVRPSPTTTVSLTGSLSTTSTEKSTHTVTSSITESLTLTGSLTPSGFLTISKHFPPTATLNVSTSSIKSEPSQTTSRFTTTQQSVTPTREPTKTSPASLKELADMLDERMGASNNQTNQTFVPVEGETLSLFQTVDRIGEELAEKLTKIGSGFHISRPHFETEVYYPNSSYTFPREASLDLARKVKSDQIYIPAKALQTSAGDFKRKFFSILYYNLPENIPRSVSVVETDTNQVHGSFVLNSRVIASSATPGISGLPGYDIFIRLAHLTNNFSSEISPMCAFLQENGQRESNVMWSTEGCILDETLSNKNVSVCRCNHLTHFGILMQVNPPALSLKDVQALSIITYIGCALSLVAVCLTVLAIACLPGARSDRNFIHVNLAVAIGLAQVTFLAGIDETEHEVLCTIVAALLHYFLLVAFSWMLIEGIFLHILIVKVFHDQLPKKRFYVTFCWGLPLVVVLLSVNLLRDGYGTEGSCWLSTEKFTIWTFSGPVILVMIINIIILCKVMKEISSLQTSDRQDANVRSIRYGVRSTVILLPLLGLTWIFGLICVNDSLVVFQYLFTIFNSLQGLFIFLFHCVFNTEVRKAFWRKVDIWFTNHNSPFGHNGNSLKKSKDEPSSIGGPDKDNNIPERNGVSMYSFSGLSERDRRKLSTTTASTCLEPWPHKLSLTPSLDSGPFSNRFTPSLSSDDVKYQPIYKHGAGQKRVSPRTFEIKVEDLNGNTHAMGCESVDRANRSLGDRGRSIEVNSTQDIETETNFVQKRHPAAEAKEKQQNAHIKRPIIAINHERNVENSKSNQESYVQKHSQQDFNSESKPNKTLLNKTQEKPQPSKKPSRGSLVGIGGKHLNAEDRTGHVRDIDVNSSTESCGTKL